MKGNVPTKSNPNTVLIDFGADMQPLSELAASEYRSVTDQVRYLVHKALGGRNGHTPPGYAYTTRGRSDNDSGISWTEYSGEFAHGASLVSGSKGC